MFVSYASEIWTKSYGFELFDQKTVFFVTIFDKELTPFWKT